MRKHFVALFFYFFVVTICSALAQDFVLRKGTHFILGKKDYNYIGANYWYGGLLALTENGKIRLRTELDFLAKHGINNLRIMTVVEGEGVINGVPRVSPAFQPGKGVYKNELLYALDFLLAEMGKRKLKAVLYLSNNWNWTGGFMQYLNWNGLMPDSIFKRKLTWDEQRDYTSKFYSCAPCISQQYEVLKKIVGRINSITHKKYTDDTAIMSWELANEPRPMRPAAIPVYKKWIAATASLIKKIDKHHLVTTGVEGDMGTENLQTFSDIHQDKNIDYATIHIWPKNWGWFKDTSIAKSLNEIKANTKNYIDRHAHEMTKINKPLVIEEFGLPRDEHLYSLSAGTGSRNIYYGFIMNELVKSIHTDGVIRGVNFWGFGGIGRPSHKQLLWMKGEDMLGDPPPEEQGLNTVFDTDTSTWKIISDYKNKLAK